jgi:hypothetical protein
VVGPEPSIEASCKLRTTINVCQNMRNERREIGVVSDETPHFEGYLFISASKIVSLVLSFSTSSQFVNHKHVEVRVALTLKPSWRSGCGLKPPLQPRPRVCLPLMNSEFMHFFVPCIQLCNNYSRQLGILRSPLASLPSQLPENERDYCSCYSDTKHNSYCDYRPCRQATLVTDITSG